MNIILNPHITILPLTIGIIALRTFWVATEARSYKHRINADMLKTNTIEAAILIAQILCALYFPWPTNPLDPYLMTVGLILYLLGGAGALWARLTMRGVWGIPGERYQNQNKVVTTGPFAFSRNPIYLGFALLYIGYCLALRSWLVILRIPLLIYFYKSALKEEKDLEKEFGKPYIYYKKRTPRFLIK